MGVQRCTAASAASRAVAHRQAQHLSKHRRPLMTSQRSARCRLLHHRPRAGPHRQLHPYEVRAAAAARDPISAASSNAASAPCVNARDCCGMHLPNRVRVIGRSTNSAARGARLPSTATSASVRSATCAANHPQHLHDHLRRRPHPSHLHPRRARPHHHPHHFGLGQNHRHRCHRRALHLVGLRQGRLLVRCHVRRLLSYPLLRCLIRHCLLRLRHKFQSCFLRLPRRSVLSLVLGHRWPPLAPR